MNSNNEVLLHHLSELKSSVEISVASLFTKDDVLSILNFLEREVREFEVSEVKLKQEPCDDQTIELSPYLLPNFVNHLQVGLADFVHNFDETDIVDASQFDYEIDYDNRISVSNINLDRNNLEIKIWDKIFNALESYEL